jgi:hypothetical protein
MSKVEDRGAYVRNERIRLRIRRVDADRYRVSDANGHGVEFRKRHDLPDAVAKAVDAAADGVVFVEGWLNRAGRWSIRTDSVKATEA